MGKIHLKFVYKQYSDANMLTLSGFYKLIRDEDNNFAGNIKDKEFVMRYYLFFNSIVVL